MPMGKERSDGRGAGKVRSVPSSGLSVVIGNVTGRRSIYGLALRLSYVYWPSQFQIVAGSRQCAARGFHDERAIDVRHNSDFRCLLQLP